MSAHVEIIFAHVEKNHLLSDIDEFLDGEANLELLGERSSMIRNHRTTPTDPPQTTMPPRKWELRARSNRCRITDFHMKTTTNTSDAREIGIGDYP